ncbi:MAG: hypothetical protein N2Z80_07395 [Hydrogenothermaceae bacterium]|nr:hypothetical protein [Hydrogenothermaceae bacterium]
MLRRTFLLGSFFLYLAFILEAVTGYWIEKPRILGSMFWNIIDRRDAYTLHSFILPAVMYVLLGLHTAITFRRYLFRTRWFVFIFLNTLLLTFLIYLHLV